jgi:hypothetical protein
MIAKAAVTWAGKVVGALLHRVHKTSLVGRRSIEIPLTSIVV